MLRSSAQRTQLSFGSLPTRDLDLLGFGDRSADPMIAVFREICAIPIEENDIFVGLLGWHVVVRWK
jgi:hypothetical protein